MVGIVARKVKTVHRTRKTGKLNIYPFGAKNEKLNCAFNKCRIFYYSKRQEILLDDECRTC